MSGFLKNLKRDYRKDNPDGSYTVWPADRFGVLVTFENRSPVKQLIVRASLVDKNNSNKSVVTFPNTTYNAEGVEGPVENQSEVDTYNAEVEARQLELTALRASIKDKEEERDETPKKIDGKENPAWVTIAKEVEVLQKSYREKEQSYSEFSRNPVRPIKNKIDKYTDLMGLYDPAADNPLGALWLKRFTPGGVNISDEIVGAVNVTAKSVKAPAAISKGGTKITK